MKRSLENFDLTEGHDGTKARKSLDFDCKDGDAAGTGESASGWRRKSSWNSERNHAKRTPALEKQEKQKKKKAETSEGLDQLQS